MTPRQRQAYELILLGKSDKEIAAQLKLKLPTAKAHVGKLLRKFGAGSRQQLLSSALWHSIHSSLRLPIPENRRPKRKVS